MPEFSDQSRAMGPDGAVVSDTEIPPAKIPPARSALWLFLGMVFVFIYIVRWLIFIPLGFLSGFLSALVFLKCCPWFIPSAVQTCGASLIRVAITITSGWIIAPHKIRFVKWTLITFCLMVDLLSMYTVAFEQHHPLRALWSLAPIALALCFGFLTPKELTGLQDAMKSEPKFWDKFRKLNELHDRFTQ